jgi:hypothetical protein
MDIVFLEETEDQACELESQVADFPGELGPIVPDDPPRPRRPRWRWWIAAILGVLGIAAGMSVPPIVSSSRRNRCMEQLRQIGLALQGFHEAQKHFPAAAITSKDGQRLLSWRVAILPQLGFQSLYDEFHLDEPWDSPHNITLLPRMPAVFACPSMRAVQPYGTGYQVVVGPKPELGSIGTAFEWGRGVEIREFIDGTSNTVMVVETLRPIPWTQPDDPEFDRDGPTPEFGSGHDGGFHAVFADGSTRFLKGTIDPRTLRAILTRDGTEVISGGS